MQAQQEPLRLDQPACYQIKIQGRLAETWSEWFDQMAISVEHEDEAVVTTLKGTVIDQAALYGLLSRIRDLGLPLLLVERIV
jgi:hypothetical protein